MKQWSGGWNDWIAPFHKCPRCEESLSWKQTTDVFDRPMIHAEHCGIIFSAMLKPFDQGGGP